MLGILVLNTGGIIDQRNEECRQFVYQSSCEICEYQKNGTNVDPRIKQQYPELYGEDEEWMINWNKK